MLDIFYINSSFIINCLLRCPKGYLYNGYMPRGCVFIYRIKYECLEYNHLMDLNCHDQLMRITYSLYDDNPIWAIGCMATTRNALLVLTPAI